MGHYANNPLWSDLTPLPTEDGGPNALASISYTPEYEECMSYLRAAMAANDHSLRILDLTADLISMNPAHYTVWLYRAQALFANNSDLREELDWLNETALDHQKNYQIWHHRMLIVDKLGSVEGERTFIETMFERDAKNYHVWSYRQWLVRRFDLWDDGEVEFTTLLIRRDPRNNSAWNHRWFVLNGRAEGEANDSTAKVAGVVEDETLRKREIQFAKDNIAREPQNQCPWNYLKGIHRKAGIPLRELQGFVEGYACLDRPGEVKSSYALDLLAGILADEAAAAEEGSGGDEEERRKGRTQAVVALDLLRDKYDPIRKNYWEWRKSLLVGEAGTEVKS